MSGYVLEPRKPGDPVEPGSTYEIEVTSEMIEAGIDALRPYLPSGEPIGNISRMVEAVLSAASLCRRP